MSLSVVIIAFKSDHILKNLIKSIPSNNEIIVIENSLNNEIKKELEAIFSNLRVIIPNQNLGYSGGVNLGVKESRSNFVMVLTADVNFSIDIVNNIQKLLEKFNDFTLLAPVYKNLEIHKNFKIFHSGKINELNYGNLKLKEVDEIDGACFVLNKNYFEGSDVMDENFFLYFDSTDLCHQLKKEKKKMYIIENLKFTHKGTASSKKEYEFEILVNRNWHYSWSKFYFYKKNFSYFYALKKISPNFFRSLIKYIYFIIVFDSKKKRLHQAVVSGIFNSILLRNSFHRPNIK